MNMPGTQRKLSLVTKSGRLGENPSSSGSSTSMTDNTPPFPGQLGTNSFVERISAEVLKGVEASFDKTIDPVLKQHEVYANKITTLDTRVTEAEGRILSQEDATAIYGAKLSYVKSKLTVALDKIDNLENRSRGCNIWLRGCQPCLFLQNLVTRASGQSVKLDCCHRALTRRPPPNQRPWAVIIKFHNFQDKVRICKRRGKYTPCYITALRS